MSKFLPKSLFGQTLLILLAGLALSHMVGSWIYTSDREQAVRVVGGFAAAQRIANLTRLVEDAPQDWRERLVAGLNDQTFKVTFAAEPPAISAPFEENPLSQSIGDYLMEQVPAVAGRQPRVAVSAPVGPLFRGFHPMMGRGPMMYGLGGFRDVQVAMPLTDGQWLLFVTALPDTGPAFSRNFFVSMAVMSAIILALSVWVVRRVTAPLASLAAAAELVGRGMTSPALPETGTIETRQASRAFNTMQVRLRTMIENRMRMLAAISHDLRTPLTLLRLRAENVEDAQERVKMLATIAEMDSMIGATLQFARDEMISEPRHPTDLAALLQSIADDMADAGLPVIMQPAEPVVYECRSVAIKRALTNLIDNAVKYGKKADVAISVMAQSIEIAVDDVGPGLPESEIARVFEPFYRVEESRNPETGGVGLGLAIAQSIVQSQGGELTLENRPGGGLRALVRLPR